ncbi:uncharacterized protein LOC117101745 [Anneissia japonica]|uniref:uncharacterized protein LOC117101745 n=1 Tax=Anneissia japonica TaxID=1529436 RepID=UPI001425AC18|nr:uncharacterized protein LOC117101745 [Anneissia japonica]
MATTNRSNEQNVKPVFIKDDDIRKKEEEYLKEEDIYFVLNTVMNCDHLVGLQKVKNLWRVYIDDHSERVKVITSGLNIRGKHVNVHDVNPYLSGEISTRILLKDIPLSVRNQEITDALRKLGCNILGEVQYVKFRIKGKLSRFLNGDRAVFVEPFKDSLPRFLKINNFNARIFHKDQKDANKCFECGLPGHRANGCPKKLEKIKCHTCNRTGHMARNCKEMIQLDDNTPTSLNDKASSETDLNISDSDEEDNDVQEEEHTVEHNDSDKAYPDKESSTDKSRDVIEIIEHLLNKPANPGNAQDSVELDEKVQQIMQEAIERVKSINHEGNTDIDKQPFKLTKKDRKKLKKREKKTKKDEQENKHAEKAGKSIRGMRPITDFATAGIPEAVIAQDNHVESASVARQNFAGSKRNIITHSGEKNAEKKEKKSDSVS